MDRRGFLRLGSMAAAGSLALACGNKDDGDDTGSGSSGDGGAGDAGAGDGGSGACTLTDDNILGPFYREDAPERDELDFAGPDGVELSLSGRVLDSDCNPIAGARVDLWQADPEGEYDNTSDEMRYRGVVTCDADGRWAVQTKVPGFYLNGSQFRPAHIHVKIWVDDIDRLTTQLYFEGDPYLDIDPYVEDAPVMAVTETDKGWSCSVDIVV